MQLRRMATHRIVRVLRVLLPFVIVGLIAIPARNYWVARKHSPTAEAQAKDLPVDLAALINGFLHSHTEGGGTPYTVKAKGFSEFKDHKYFLREVEVTVNGRREGDPPRKVSSDECSYDEQTGDIRFMKNVNAQLDEKTFAHTEELTYNHHDDIISTQVTTHFEQPGEMTGAADRFEYEMHSGLLRLNGNVHVDLKDGSILKTGAAVFQSKENWVTVSQGVSMQSPNGWLSGNTGRAELQPMTYHPTRIVVEGGVTSESRHAGSPETWKLRSSWMQASMSPASGNIEHVFARGDVRVDKISPAASEVLTGSEVEAAIDADGRISTAEARGNARVEDPDRTLTAPKIVTDAAQTARTEGRSMLKTKDSTLEGSDFTIEKDKITTQAASTLSTPDHRIEGRNFTIVQSPAVVKFSTPFHAVLTSGERRSEADKTTAQFEAKTNRLLQLEQTGHFEFKEGARSGRAGRAVVTEAGDIIVLDGSPIATVSDVQMKLDAKTIQLNQKTNEFIATGDVTTISTTETERVVVKSARGQRDGDSMIYTGRVRVWRGDSTIEADSVKANDKDNTFHAEGHVKSQMDVFEARADALDYASSGSAGGSGGGSNTDKQSAHYTGNVQAWKRDPKGEMRLNSREMTLNIAAGAVTDATAEGSVDLRQGARHGTGDKAVYNKAADETILSGQNAMVTDPKQGESHGTRLLVKNGGDVVVMEGPPAGRVVSKFKVQK